MVRRQTLKKIGGSVAIVLSKSMLDRGNSRVDGPPSSPSRATRLTSTYAIRVVALAVGLRPSRHCEGAADTYLTAILDGAGTLLRTLPPEVEGSGERAGAAIAR